MARQLRWGVVGGGGDSLIGIVHRIAANMRENYRLVCGCFNPNWNENLAFGLDLGLSENRIYRDFDEMIKAELSLPADQRIQVVSVLTPNFLHFPMAKKLVESGFHVICEKPLTTTYAEAQDLQKTAEGKNLVFGVTYTYTGYPMIREMRHLITSGAIGELQRVDLQYYQGWINPIIHDPEARSKTWRLDPKQSGISCAIGDIGTHAYDMLEYVTGERVSQILADLNFLYDDNQMDIDGTVMVRIGQKAKGVLRVSQIATGEENNFTVAIYGKKGGLKWEQMNPNYLTHLTETGPMQVIKPGYAFNSELAQGATKLPPGHPEGMFDSMGNIYNGVAKAIRGENYDTAEFPTLEDGVRGMNFIEQVVASYREGNIWKTLK